MAASIKLSLRAVGKKSSLILLKMQARMWGPLHYIFLKMRWAAATINAPPTFRILFSRMFQLIHYIFVKIRRVAASLNEASPRSQEKGTKEE